MGSLAPSWITRFPSDIGLGLHEERTGRGEDMRSRSGRGRGNHQRISPGRIQFQGHGGDDVPQIGREHRLSPPSTTAYQEVGMVIMATKDEGRRSSMTERETAGTMGEAGRMAAWGGTTTTNAATLPGQH